MKLIYYLIFIMICIGCTSTSNRSNNKVQSQSGFFNEDLQIAAKKDTSFYGKRYHILADSIAKVFIQEKNDTTLIEVFELNRGNSFIFLDEYYGHNNFHSIIIPDSNRVFFIEKSIESFPQFLEGMPFPLIGIVKEEGQYLEFFDKMENETKKMSLPKGSDYFFVIDKGGYFINVWDSKNLKPLTGVFCCELNIIQAHAHLKIMKKYETTMKRILKSSLNE